MQQHFELCQMSCLSCFGNFVLSVQSRGANEIC